MESATGDMYEMPRVLQVSAISWVIPRQILPLAYALRERGFVVDVASAGGPEIVEVREAGFGHMEVEFSRGWSIVSHVRALLSLRRVVRKGRYEILHLHGPIPGLLGRLVGKWLSIPTIYHCRGTLYDLADGSVRERVSCCLFSICEWIMGPFTSWAFTLNPKDARDLEVHARVPRERIICTNVGGCGLDVDVWSPSSVDAEDVARKRGELGIDDQQVIVGFVGRIVEAKGVLDLYDAFTNLRRSGINAHLLCVGDVLPNERDQYTRGVLADRIARDGNDRFVSLVGDVSDPRVFIACMDVLVLPSYREGFGQVLVEAGAMEKPVVAYRSRGTEHAVLDGETGLLVERGSIKEMTDAIATIVSDSERSSKMGRRARMRAEIELSRDAFVSRVVPAYDSIVSAGRSKKLLNVQ